jgi:phage tail sheath protein FI
MQTGWLTLLFQKFIYKLKRKKMATYRTPGAYVEEIRKFPPSIAPVATAIPAFIGYTEKAEKNGEVLTNVPTRIRSFPEFVQVFGGPPRRDVYIQVDSNGRLVNVRAVSQAYLLYDCIRHFYANGGRICYVVSVGDYTIAPALGDIANPIASPGFLVGLQALRKYEEPTIIVAPDAVNLPGFGLYTFQQAALQQCEDLKDRMLICDLKASDDNRTDLPDWQFQVEEFRERIGINNLKYAAAYYPWIRAELLIALSFREVLFTIDDITAPGFTPPTAASSMTVLRNLTTDNAVLQLLEDLNDSRIAVDDLPNRGFSANVDLREGTSSLEAGLNTRYDAFLNDFNVPTNAYPGFGLSLPALYQWILELLLTLRDIRNNLPAPGIDSGFRLRTDIDGLLPELRSIFNTLVAHHIEIAFVTTPSPGLELFRSTGTNRTGTFGFLDYPAAVTSFDTIHTNRSAASYHLNAHHRYWAIRLRNAALDGPIREIVDTSSNVSDLVSDLVPIAIHDFRRDIGQIIDDARNITPPPTTYDLDAVRISLIGEAASEPRSVPHRVAAEYVTAILNVGLLEGTAALTLLDEFIPVPDIILNEVLSAWADIHQRAGRESQGGTSLLSIQMSLGGAGGAIDTITSSANIVRQNVLLAAQGARNGARDIINIFSRVFTLARDYEVNLGNSLMNSFGIYKQLLTTAAQRISVIPPGCTMAGIYATIDRERGVWKAPANVSISAVSGPAVVLSVEDQEDLNMPTSGKAINAIRQFIGKGTLVWGARTLAGNDNEWRYVNVRRFFNFAQASTKAAVEAFVFEPNDANTWVRVKAMIENFLRQQWRAGALQGATPAQAFFVHIGLGETMTEEDINEGRMIVEIGMAVVRPAEFIILQFSHKMAES